MPDNEGITRPGTGKAIVAVVVMGVSGCGKTVVAEALAARLGCRFVEGDRLHPPENIKRMADGQPLTDAHRQGWLDAVGSQIAAAVSEHRGVVAACSALKRSYRARLREWCGSLVFIHLTVDKDTARLRVGSRKGHFMPASLVESQFADLEPPGPAENALVLNAARPIADLVTEAARYAQASFILR